MTADEKKSAELFPEEPGSDEHRLPPTSPALEHLSERIEELVRSNQAILKSQRRLQATMIGGTVMMMAVVIIAVLKVSYPHCTDSRCATLAAEQHCSRGRCVDGLYCELRNCQVGGD